MKICFLVSGNGGNLKFFDLALKKGIIKNVKLQVIADRNCGALNYAIKSGIPNRLITYKIDKTIELNEALDNFRPDLTMTNWHKIIDKHTVEKWKERMVNLHYSLLPAFKGFIGIKPIELSFSNNCQYIGATTHFVEEEVDGGKIICQTIIKRGNISIEDAIKLIFRRGCLILLNSIVLITGREDIININEKETIEFSPNLKFDQSIFDENFWNEVSLI